MDRTFDFGPLRIQVTLEGEEDEKPVFKVDVSVEGQTYELGVRTTPPLPAQAALYIVSEMRKAARMGAKRYVDLVVMRERLTPERAKARREEASALASIARAVPGGEVSLAAVEEALKAELEKEKLEFETGAQKTAEAVDEGKTVAFNLGSVGMVVELIGMVANPEGEGELAFFRVTAQVPGGPPHQAQVMTNAPLYSSAAGWLLREMRKILEVGQDRYAQEQIGPVWKTIDDATKYASEFYAIASAVGLAGLDHAARELEKAAAQERADAEEAELQRLEAELEEVRRQLAALRTAKRRPRGK